MKYGNVPGVHSIYEGINKLEPGSILEFHKSSKRMRTYKYWSSAESINKNQLKRFDGSEDDAVRKLESLLTDTIEMQMISDVPIGAFLSSGIDSSTIVSLMQKVSSNPVKTFTIGFEEETYNEAPYAKEIANHLGTSHHELYISTKDVLEEIRKIPEIYDEPFADQSQIPTYLVCKMARDKVKVAAAIARPVSRTLIFSNTKAGCDRLVRKLLDEGIRAQSIHGDLRQNIREKALDRFASGKLPVLVATDVAALGIHVDGVEVVIHYDPPSDHKTYLHRSGRTARAGTDGLVVTLSLWDEELVVKRLQKRVGLDIELVEMFSNDPRLADLGGWIP